MAASRADIQRWLDHAKRGGYKSKPVTHVVVVCDTFDYEDYPVYVYEGDDVHKAISEHSGNMQRVMEVYNMSMSIEDQMKERRAYNL